MIMSSGERHRGGTKHHQSPLSTDFYLCPDKPICQRRGGEEGSQKVGRWSVDWNKGTLGTSLVGRCIGRLSSNIYCENKLLRLIKCFR